MSGSLAALHRGSGMSGGARSMFSVLTTRVCVCVRVCVKQVAKSGGLSGEPLILLKVKKDFVSKNGNMETRSSEKCLWLEL